ncbi:uncharacterized protein RHTO_07385 [Rhodotorula toruloides NP11]|uniref:Secreted protein n=1 Tax=Rhodotorula toruloides (strain NP11) TaxID=1130832 RepID=M7WZZ8_RHOT1|nr:uncharacterized protein RHTO_07385 [Rhodotorula toruloides NP11]EMS23651.1 hypothetical protein RHTO_07385 [Rhodotorula toruloides NP11]
MRARQVQFRLFLFLWCGDWLAGNGVVAPAAQDRWSRSCIAEQARSGRGEAGTRSAGPDFANECPSHSNRVFATRSPPALWSRLFVQLLSALQRLDPAPAAPRHAVEQTAKAVQTSTALARLAGGAQGWRATDITASTTLASSTRLAAASGLATTVRADSRSQDREPRHPFLPSPSPFRPSLTHGNKGLGPRTTSSSSYRFLFAGTRDSAAYHAST